MSPRHPPKFTGIFQDDTPGDSCWIRETGVVLLPALKKARTLVVVGEVRPAEGNDPTAAGPLGLALLIDGRMISQREQLAPGPFRLEVPWPSPIATPGHALSLQLTGVGWSNLLAWLGRVTGLGPLQPWRKQARNRRLRLQRIEADSDVLFDFANRDSPWNAAISRRLMNTGLNLAGYFRADLGIGESVRCAARAADAAGLGLACINLKLHCINPQTDDTFADRLQTGNPHPVNVIHLDAPASRDIEHHHGAGFRRGKYNIGYWAWELPEFPDSWINYGNYFQEIWTPSRFTTDAIGQKLDVPVLTMPHAISFARPQGECRRKFGLPADKFIFLFLYDLNSYSERKNPAAVLEAFRRSGLAGRDAALVIKVHNTAGNPGDYARLQAAASALPGTTLITQTLSRAEIYELQSACDCFVSLHRSEGFGLAVAECMYLGKPVISTDWSGTAEYVSTTNGCPVRCALVTLDRDHGPYAKGQTWAEPDVDHAAEWMSRLFADRALARSLGSAARVTIEERFSPAIIGARYKRRLETIAGW